MLDKIKSKYGKDLPGKSAFRNDPDAPVKIEDISKEFGSWDVFVEKYKEYLAPKPKQPAAKTSTKTVNNEAK